MTTTILAVSTAALVVLVLAVLRREDSDYRDTLENRCAQAEFERDQLLAELLALKRRIAAKEAQR